MTADHTMTDTTKPTGDTIDDAIMELANIMCGEPEICEEHWEAAESAIKAGYRRLAERPNRAVARGDSVTITMEDAMTIHYVVQDAALKNRTGNVRIGKAMCAMRQPALDKALAITTSLTTPTETTDPAMEGDDAE